MIKNRLEKNFKKLKAWQERHQIEAFRLYDRDIPEYPFIVDVYKDHYLIHDKSESFKDAEKNHLPHVVQALESLFKLTPNQIVLKKRERQEGKNQYEKLDQRDDFFVIRESQALLRVNLHDYLDTGLFLDHRPLRQKIFKTSKGQRFLNLFCYTASVSVFAALGGAKTTSVDMSQTYLNWAAENFKLNDLPLAEHEFVNANALEYLQNYQGHAEFDLIFLDPPTFSNSKKMEDTFEVEKDQDFIVDKAMGLLKPNGILYFSNNKRKFKLSDQIQGKYLWKDISKETIPQDFHDQRIHHCFELRHRPKL